MKKPPKYALIKRLALALPGASEEHDRLGTWFNIGRKTFVLYSDHQARWIFKLPRHQLHMIFDARPEIFAPMRSGALLWAYVRVEDLSSAELYDYITTAWRTVATKKLANEYFSVAQAKPKPQKTN